MDKKYEIAYIFSTQGEPVEQICQSVRDGLQKLSITIEDENDMGVRDLCYPINKQSNGHYYVFTIRMEPSATHQLEGHYKHNDTVLRHLVIRMEK